MYAEIFAPKWQLVRICILKVPGKIMRHSLIAAVCCGADGPIIADSTWKTMGFFRVETDLTLGQVRCKVLCRQQQLNGGPTNGGRVYRSCARHSTSEKFDDVTRKVPKDAIATGKI